MARSIPFLRNEAVFMSRIATLLTLGALAFVPACSLLFDGSGYRPGSGTDAGNDGGGADGATGCTVESCELGLYCDEDTGTCLDGCDEDDDCNEDEYCDFDNEECVVGTICERDLDCVGAGTGFGAVGGWCNDDGVCEACDGDGDLWVTDAPGSASCETRPGIVGVGDCDDDVATTHPLALPDCNPVTNETCDPTGMRARAVNPNLADIGYFANAVISGGGESSLHAFPIAHDDDTVELVAIYLRAGVPQVVRVVLAQGVEPTINVDALPGWLPVEGVVETSLAAQMSEAGDRIFVVTHDLLDGGISPYLRRRYAATIDAAGFVLPGPVNVTGTTPDASTLGPLAVAVSPTGVASSAGVFGNGGVPALWLVGATPAGERVEGSPGAGLPLAEVGVARSAGRFGAFTVGGGLSLWNGRIDANASYLRVSTMSSARAGVATGAVGTATGVLALGTAPGGLRAMYGQCDPADLASCTIGGTDLPFAPRLADEPLFSVESLSGHTFFFSAIVDEVGLAGDGVAIGTIEVSTSGAPVPSIAGHLVVPVIGATTITEFDLGLRVGDLPSRGPVVTATYAATTPDGVRIGAFRGCIAPE